MNAHLNWQDGTWVNTHPRAAEYEICITGDWAPIRVFSQRVDDNPEAVYGDVLDELRGSDLKIANLECALTEAGDPISKSGAVFKGTPEQIKGLTCVPFDMVTLANNHVFDYGQAGFRETRTLLRTNGIKRLGAGLTRKEAIQPQMIALGETTIAVVNFCEGEDLTGAVSGPGVFGWEINTVLEAVKKCKATADLVLVVCHAGVEYIPFPPPYLVKALHAIAQAGADLIVGHHPHVPQGMQILGGVPIAYSLGNFVFYQPTDLACRKVGYLLKAGVSGGVLTRIKLVPYRISDQGLSLLKGETLTRFLKKMRQISEPLASMAGVEDAWNGFLRYYGMNGFFEEVNKIMGVMREEPAKGAAMMRNRVATMQHREHWIDAMNRVIEGTIEESPDWAYERVQEWMTDTV